MTRIFTGFMLGIGATLIAQSPIGRKIMTELGNTVSDMAMSGIKEVKKEFTGNMVQQNNTPKRSSK